MASLNKSPEEFDKYLEEPFCCSPARSESEEVAFRKYLAEFNSGPALPEPVLVAHKRPLPDIDVSGTDMSPSKGKAAKKSARRRRAVSKLPCHVKEDNSAARMEDSVPLSAELSVPVPASISPTVEQPPALPAAAAVGAPPLPPGHEDTASAASSASAFVPMMEVQPFVAVCEVSLDTHETATKEFFPNKKKPKYMQLDFSQVQVAPPKSATSTVLFRPASTCDDLTQAHQGLVFKDILAIAKPRTIRDIRGGALAVDFNVSTNLEPLLAISQLAGIIVKPCLPAGQATSAGVIHGLHPGVTEEEFLREASSDVAIAGLFRLAKPGATTWVAKLVFKGPDVPNRVFFAGRSFRVKLYKTRPLQCSKCFKFGHTAKYCKTGHRCPKCGKGHEPQDCKEPERCPNCFGPHSATYQNCPAFSFEKKVSQLTQQGNVSRVAAKTCVKAAAKTYAEATRPPRQRPEPSRNTIFSSKPSPDKASAFVADIVTAVLMAAKNQDFSTLFSSLENLLKNYSGRAPLPGSLKDLVTMRALPPAAV